MAETIWTLKLDTLAKINAVRQALQSGYKKGMWSKAEMEWGLANMDRVESKLRERIESN